MNNLIAENGIYSEENYSVKLTAKDKSGSVNLCAKSSVKQWRYNKLIASSLVDKIIG